MCDRRQMAQSPWWPACLPCTRSTWNRSRGWRNGRTSVLTSLLAYVRWQQELKAAGAAPFAADNSGSTARLFFWASVGAFALSLMSKPMVVTLPFVLLLLDLWPLGRIPLALSGLLKLAREKWIFFGLSAAACVVTYLVQQHTHAVQSEAQLPLAGRVENVWVSYALYLAKTFWPVNLAVYYPHPGHWPAAEWAPAAALVILISWAALRWRAAQPYFLVGWFWFLGTLVPVIGLVQAGTQAMADRYAYLPTIGLFIAVVWGASALLERLRVPRLAAGLAAIIVLAACATVTRQQLSFWQNDGTLFSHALAVTPDNPVSEVLLGVYLNKVNQPELAARHFRAALALDPNDKTAHIDMGLYYEKIGKPEAAMVECREAIRCDAKFYPAIYYLGLLLEQLGRRDEAIAQYKATLAVQPDYADAKQRLRALGAPVP